MCGESVVVVEGCGLWDRVWNVEGVEYKVVGVIKPVKRCDQWKLHVPFMFNRYGMRYVAMQLRLALVEKFPDAPDDEILKVQ